MVAAAVNGQRSFEETMAVPGLSSPADALNDTPVQDPHVLELVDVGRVPNRWLAFFHEFLLWNEIEVQGGSQQLKQLGQPLVCSCSLDVLVFDVAMHLCERQTHSVQPTPMYVFDVMTHVKERVVTYGSHGLEGA